MSESRNEEEDRGVTRRVFLQHSAAISALSVGACGLSLKTDALAEEPKPVPFREPADDFPYPYYDPNG
jgi:hypothetical protein